EDGSDGEQADLVAGQRQRHAEDATTPSNGDTWLLLERRQGQPEPLELRPVKLGLLLLPRPDDGPARVVDPVRELHSPVVADAGEHAGEGERDPLKRVVVVVQDDDAPRVPATRPGASRTP